MTGQRPKTVVGNDTRAPWEKYRQVKPRVGMRIRKKMPDSRREMRYFSRRVLTLRRRVSVSRENVVCLAGRVLALLFTVCTLCELSYLPEYVQSFLHYADYEIGPTTNIQYLAVLAPPCTHCIGFPCCPHRRIRASFRMVLQRWPRRCGTTITRSSSIERC